MRLGLTNYTYQWLFAPAGGQEFVDRASAFYDFRGLPLPYLTQTGRTLSPDSFEVWQIDRAQALGLPVVHCPIVNWDEENLGRIRERLTTNGQEIVPAIGANLIATGVELEQEIDNTVALIRRYHDFGNIRLSKFCIAPMVHNRFRHDPPLSVQLERIVAGLPQIVEAAEAAGIVLAFENHLDYRAAEVVEIIDHVASPYLRFLFDTGNPFGVCEDPVTAAELAAPYTVLVHVKDVRVVPWTPMSLGYFACMYACPLGEGNVDLDRIVEIMRDHAPNGNELVFAIEVTPIPPSEDEDRWLEHSTQWMKERFASYLTS